MLKDTRGVSFVNLADRATVKLCESEFRHDGGPYHGSLHYLPKIQQFHRGEFSHGMTIVSLESGKSHQLREITIKC